MRITSKMARNNRRAALDLSGQLREADSNDRKTRPNDLKLPNDVEYL